MNREEYYSLETDDLDVVHVYKNSEYTNYIIKTSLEYIETYNKGEVSDHKSFNKELVMLLNYMIKAYNDKHPVETFRFDPIP
jgi:hypothetical protein